MLGGGVWARVVMGFGCVKGEVQRRVRVLGDRSTNICRQRQYFRCTILGLISSESGRVQLFTPG
jgi:hypothetical protein